MPEAAPLRTKKAASLNNCFFLEYSNMPFFQVRQANGPNSIGSSVSARKNRFLSMEASDENNQIFLFSMKAFFFSKAQ